MTPDTPLVPLAALPVGGRINWTTPPVTTTQLVRYAGASGDFNPLHFDHHFALAAGLDGVIAHGMLTMGFMAVALGRVLRPQDRLCSLNARFTSPVLPGDSVQIHIQITERDANDKPHGLVHCRISASVGERQVAQGTARVEIHHPAA